MQDIAIEALFVLYLPILHFEEGEKREGGRKEGRERGREIGRERERENTI